MTVIAMRLGQLGPDALGIKRSGLRWLRGDGHLCRANEIVAYCSLRLTGAPQAFGEEGFDLQVALAPRMPGRIRRTEAASPGGFLDRAPSLDWTPDEVWGRFEPLSGNADEPIDEPNLLFMAGRRFTNVAEDRSGLLTGWHDRTRGWWGEGLGATLLAMGACEQVGLIRGADRAYSSLFEAAAGSAQVVMTQGAPLEPCAIVLRQQFARTRKEVAAIRQDMATHFFEGGAAPTAAGWLFMGALLNGLERSALDERYDLLTRTGLLRTPPAAAICLSPAGESPYLLRHRRLGYMLNIFAFRLEGVGRAVRDWLRREFEPVFQSVDDVARDYRQLIEAAPHCAFILVNQIASRANESIQSYDAFDDHTMAHLSSLRTYDLNLMLHDLARAPNVELVDADAIAADLGVAEHMPDGIHATEQLQAETRAELLRCLRRQRVAGF